MSDRRNRPQRIRLTALPKRPADEAARDNRVVSQSVAATDVLLEREANLERLALALERARSGEGSVVLVEGEAGIGKTALLEVAKERALTAGCTVLTARGGELERDFAHGVARQLYEPLLHAAAADRREALLHGAAQLAAPVLGLTVASKRSSEGFAGDPGFAANHGLYWLTANLAESGTLLLVVDDAH